jgi:MFS family permease
MSTTLDMEKSTRPISPVVALTTEVTTAPDLENRPTTIGSPEEAELQPPQHGIHSYLQVVGLFFVYLITLGQLAAFSTYQDYYQQEMLAAYSPSTISWIGTTQVFLLGIVGLLSGAMYDRGYIHQALIPGFVLLVLGLLLLSFSHQFWHVLLSQGFLIGIGGALFYIPAISIVSNSFPTRRALALGIAASGSAVGGIIWPIVFRRLLPSIGFAWVNRVFTLLVLILSVVSYYALTIGRRLTRPSHQTSKRAVFRNLFSRRPKDESGSENDIEISTHGQSSTLRAAFNGRAYQLLCLGVFFALLGYWVPLFYLVPYASQEVLKKASSSGTLSASPTYASYLLSILNAASLFGRILPAAVGHKVGAANILLAMTTSLGILVFAWIDVESIAGITVWSIFLGYVLSLFPFV